MEYVKVSRAELSEILEWAHHGVECDRLTADITGDDCGQEENKEMVKEWDKIKERKVYSEGSEPNKQSILHLERVIQDGEVVATEMRLNEFVLQDEYSISDGQVEYVNTALEELFDILLRRNEFMECDSYTFTALNAYDFAEAEEIYKDDPVNFKLPYQEYWAYETGRD